MSSCCSCLLPLLVKCIKRVYSNFVFISWCNFQIVKIITLTYHAAFQNAPFLKVCYSWYDLSKLQVMLMTTRMSHTLSSFAVIKQIWCWQSLGAPKWKSPWGPKKKLGPALMSSPVSSPPGQPPIPVCEEVAVMLHVLATGWANSQLYQLSAWGV